MIQSEGRGTAVVIEDDADIRFLLETTLTQAGFRVHTASTGAAGVVAVRDHDPVVTTLDISLPDVDGFEVARRIRTFSSTYVLMLTGRASEIDTLLGLEAGADDYVTKPFRPREIRARIDAMLRRPRVTAGSPDVQMPSASLGALTSGPASLPPAEPTAIAGMLGPAGPPPVTPAEPAAGQRISGQHDITAAMDPSATAAGAVASVTWPGTAAAAALPSASSAAATTAAGSASIAGAEPVTPDEEGVLRVGALRVDLCARLVHLEGVYLELTRSEFEILAAIVGAPRRVLTKAELAGQLWPEHYGTGAPVIEADRRALEVHVANVRRKLGEGAAHPRFIQTVRGVGYRLAVGATR